MHEGRAEEIEEAPLQPNVLPSSNQTISGFSSIEQGGNRENTEAVAVQILGERGGGSSLSETQEARSSGGLYDRPLPCFGCGIGWFSFLLGFVFPPLWYVAAVLFLAKYYKKDPRERPGLAASAIAALICSAIVGVVLLVVFLRPHANS
ncbi:hypothetical protein UlMin_030071 [Ulmus minor]